MASDDVTDLSVDENASASVAMKNLKTNMEHFLISSMEETGPEIDFGPKGVLVFLPKIPATAMTVLVSSDNKVEALQTYIRMSLTDETKPVFEEVLSDIPLEGLNAIVEFLNNAATGQDTKE